MASAESVINKERLLQTFLEYVAIDSESRHEAAMAERLFGDLNELGCQLSWDDSRVNTGSDSDNLYCTLPGNAPGEPILLSAHLDTVAPGVGVEPVIRDGVIYSKGDTVLGSDDKAALAAIVEVLRTIVERDLPHPTIEAVFTVCEEVPLLGSRYMDYSKLTAKKAVVLDCSGAPGKIITAAPGEYELFAAVTGRSAHAGIAPETGISAIQVAAEAISNMKLLRVDEETTANIGAISASYANNIVPLRCELTAETRSRSEEKLEVQATHMVDCLKAACEKHGATLEHQLSRVYYAYSHPHDDPFVEEIVSACRKAGLEPSFGVTGGGSDANHMNRNGIKALVLGIGMEQVHTTQEHISIQSLEELAALTLALATR